MRRTQCRESVSRTDSDTAVCKSAQEGKVHMSRLHHSATINIKGESYRLKDKQKACVIAAKTAPKEAA